MNYASPKDGAWTATRARATCPDLCPFHDPALDHPCHLSSLLSLVPVHHPPRHLPVSFLVDLVPGLRSTHRARPAWSASGPCHCSPSLCCNHRGPDRQSDLRNLGHSHFDSLQSRSQDRIFHCVPDHKAVSLLRATFSLQRSHRSSLLRA